MPLGHDRFSGSIIDQRSDGFHLYALTSLMNGRSSGIDTLMQSKTDNGSSAPSFDPEAGPSRAASALFLAHPPSAIPSSCKSIMFPVALTILSFASTIGRLLGFRVGRGVPGESSMVKLSAFSYLMWSTICEPIDSMHSTSLTSSPGLAISAHNRSLERFNRSGGTCERG